MEQMYGVTDLTHLITTLTNNTSPPTIIVPQRHKQALLFSGATAENQHHYDSNVTMMLPISTYQGQVCASAAATTTTTTTANLRSGFENSYDQVGRNLGGGDNVSVRWPRQETLTLLEIRSRLDYKFKEAIQKGHLWDELSRIMHEEHGYERSGKKCREKFENLYKYYKKTKEGKSGRRNGKHYRFFLQLEALYGSEANNKRAPSIDNNFISLSNSSLYDQTSDSGNGSMEMSKKRTKGGSKWKVDIRDFIDAQMSKVMEKQEVLFDKMMRSIEDKEKERFFREEKWRKRELERIENENNFWASKRSWIEARNAALIEALHKLKKKERNQDEHVMNKIRSYNNQNFSCDGQGLSLCNQGVQPGPMLSLLQPNNNNYYDGSSSSRSNSNVGDNNSIQESCFSLFMGEGGHWNPWDNCGVKLNNHGGN